jgi:hypothetical protein
MARRFSPLRRLEVSARDRRILMLAHRKLGGAGVDFVEALRALEQAVIELIPAGRVYLLGTTQHGPIVGSIVSGVGIAAAPGGVLVMHMGRDGEQTALGSFSP